MARYGLVKRLTVVLALVSVVATTQGCAYLADRGRDAAQIADIGITVSSKPYGAAYVCGFGIVALGAGKFDGHFIGWGGDKFGVQRHYFRTLGLLPWSYSEVAWGDDYDPAKPETLQQWYAGVIGWIKEPARRPAYGISCIHYLHLGWIGLGFNIRYAEIADMLLGWSTYDLCGDDGGKTFAERDWSWWKDTPRTGPVYNPKLPF